MSGKEINCHYMQDVQFSMPAQEGHPTEPCLVIYGVTEHIYLPVSKLPWFDWKTVVLLNKAAADIGPTQRVRRLDAITPSTLTTTKTGDGMVAVIVDHGLPTQQTLSLEPAAASHLGSNLIAAGSDATVHSTKH